MVLTDSDQVGLPLIYTYEHKFPLNFLNNREMEEVISFMNQVCFLFNQSTTALQRRGML